MSAPRPAEPVPGLSVGFSTSTTVGRVELPAGYELFLVAVSGADVFVNFGTDNSASASASLTGNMLLLQGQQTLTIQSQSNGKARFVAAITASGTGMISFTPITGGI